MLRRRVRIALASLEVKAAPALYPAGALHWSAIQFRVPPSTLIVQFNESNQKGTACRISKPDRSRCVAEFKALSPIAVLTNGIRKNVPRRHGTNNSATPVPDLVASIILRLTHLNSASVKEPRQKMSFNADCRASWENSSCVYFSESRLPAS